MSASNQTATASDYLAEPLKVGEPDVFGALAVYPVWPRRIHRLAIQPRCG